MSTIRKSPLQRFRVTRLALLAVVAGALFALPSSALATPTPEIISAPASYTVSGGSLTLSSPQLGTGTCESTSGSGEWSAAQSGRMNLTLKGCHYGAGIYCTTAGQAKGTILANSLKTNLVWIDKAHTKAGVLLSAPTTVGPPPFYLEESLPFAEMSCDVVGTVKWTGSIIAQISSPKVGQEAKEWKLQFAPLYTQVEEAGPEHRLYQNGSALGWSGETKMLFSQLKKLQGS